MQTIDMTPTWAALMPAFIAALQCGTAEGQAMAREELSRLAASVDAQNARVRSGAAEEERNQFGLESVALGRERAATDLSRAADDFRATGAHMRAACYYGAAARIAPAPLVHDLRVAADLAEGAASDLVRQSLKAAREEGAAEARAALSEAFATRAHDLRDMGKTEEAAALFDAAEDAAAPDDAKAGQWALEARQCRAAALAARKTALEVARAEALPEAQAARAEAIRAAHAEGRRAGMEEARAPGPSAALAALLDSAGDAAALLEVATSPKGNRMDSGQARATIRDLRQAAAYFRAPPVQNLPGDATPAAKEEGAAQ